MKRILHEVFKDWRWKPFFCALMFVGGVMLFCLAVVLAATKIELRYLFLMLPSAICFAALAGLVKEEDWL